VLEHPLYRITATRRQQLGKFIRLLASDVDSEALAAARALGRALKADGCDFHDFASVVEAPSTAPSAGFRNDFGGDDDEPLPWRRMVNVCSGHPGCFTSKERQFLQTMQRWRGTPTWKQLNWLLALFERVRRAA
jgi:hypothetical protein